MVNKVKRIAVFVILIAVLTFGTGIMSRSSQVEGTAEKPGIIKSKNKSGKNEDLETNEDKKRKKSSKNKRNIEREIKNDKSQSFETDNANYNNGNENRQSVGINNSNNIQNGEKEENLNVE